MADNHRPTRLFRELIGAWLNAKGAPGNWRPTVKGHSLSESFAPAPWQGDLVHDLEKPIAITIRNEVKFDPSGALRDAKAAAAAASIDGSFTPYFSVSRRKADAGATAGDSLVVTDLHCLLELLKGYQIK